eukprot:85391_1
MFTTFILISWANYITGKSIEISRTITCIGITSDGSSVTCPSTYNLTSCGVKAQNTQSSTDIIGSYIDTNAPNTCKQDTQTNTLYARCCPLPTYHASLSAIDIVSSEIRHKNAVISSSCPSPSQELLGCMVYTQNGPFYGVYSANNACTVPTKDSKDGWVFALCYDKSVISDGFELTCVSVDAVWGEQSNNSSVSCPSDKENYFMTSCTGYSADATLIGYFIIDDLCTVTATTPSRANAICCRMSKMVINPSASPTSNPSMYPTIYPFTSPTIYPSKMPTIHPSYTPSQPPTLVPTSTTALSIELSIALDAPIHSSTQGVEQSKDDQDGIIGFYDKLDLFRYILIALGILVAGCVLFVMVCCAKPCRRQRQFTKKTQIMEITLSDNEQCVVATTEEDDDEEEEEMVLSDNPLQYVAAAADEEEKMGDLDGTMATMTCNADILMRDICGTAQTSYVVQLKPNVAKPLKHYEYHVNVLDECGDVPYNDEDAMDVVEGNEASSSSLSSLYQIPEVTKETQGATSTITTMTGERENDAT